MGARTDALKATIERAWQVFDILAPATTGVCVGCCMDPSIEADFLRHRARDLPDDYVRDWYYAAFADEIGHDHVAWFLPRVLEMLADGQDVACHGHEVAFQRLPLTGFPDSWRADEVICLNAFAKALFAAVLDGHIPVALDDIDSWLCMFGEGGFEIAPLLDQLWALPDNRLIPLLHRNWVHGRSSAITVSAFWAHSPARGQVWAWNTSAALLDRMEHAALAGNAQAFDLHALIAAARDGGSPP